MLPRRFRRWRRIVDFLRGGARAGVVLAGAASVRRRSAICFGRRVGLRDRVPELEHIGNVPLLAKPFGIAGDGPAERLRARSVW